jgi:hypothetical protein
MSSIPTISSPGGFWNTDIWWKDAPDNGCPANANSNNSPGVNAVTVTLFVLPFNVTVAKVTFTVATLSSGGNINWGIYDINGNKLIDSGAISTTTGGVVTAAITPNVTLPAGLYYTAVSCDNLVCKVPSLSGVPPFDTAMNRSHVRWGVAANATVSGVLPSTLGTITNLGTSLQTHPYQIFWEAA